MRLDRNHIPIRRDFFFNAGARWVESNLVPSRCELRRIEDQGSIHKSLEGASSKVIIFLFQRTLKENQLHKAIVTVIRTIGVIGTATLGPFLGTIWHVSCLIYHVSSGIFQTQNPGQKRDRSQGLREHTISLVVDGLFAISHALLIYDLFFAKKSYIKLGFKLPQHEFQRLVNKLPARQRAINTISVMISILGCVSALGAGTPYRQQ